MTASLAAATAAGDGGNLGAGIGQRLGFCRRAIPHRDLMADFHQPRGDGARPWRRDRQLRFACIPPARSFAGDDRRSARGRKPLARQLPLDRPSRRPHKMARTSCDDSGTGECEWLRQEDKGTVGVIGLGIMGGAFAQNLAAAGWRVIGYDISAARRREARPPASRSRTAPPTSPRKAPDHHHQPAETAGARRDRARHRRRQAAAPRRSSK